MTLQNITLILDQTRGFSSTPTNTHNTHMQHTKIKRTRSCMDVRIHTHIQVRAHARTHGCIYTHIHTCTHVHNTHVQLRHTCTHAHAHTRTHTHTHTYLTTCTMVIMTAAMMRQATTTPRVPVTETTTRRVSLLMPGCHYRN